MAKKKLEKKKNVSDDIEKVVKFLNKFMGLDPEIPLTTEDEIKEKLREVGDLFTDDDLLGVKNEEGLEITDDIWKVLEELEVLPEHILEKLTKQRESQSIFEELEELEEEELEEEELEEEELEEEEKVVIKKKEKKEKKETKKGKKIEKVGIIKTIVSLLQRQPISKEDILSNLVTSFPDRNADGMKATINIQINYRLKKEKGFDVQKNDMGCYFIK